MKGPHTTLIADTKHQLLKSGRSPRHWRDSPRSWTAILTFVALAFGWFWSLVYISTLIASGLPVAGTLLMMAAGFGPSLAGLTVMFMFGTRADVRDWLSRCLNWRVGWRWFVLAFALPPTMMLLAISVHVLLGGSNPISITAGQIPLAILNFALVLIAGGPLGEEFGWRGYLTPGTAEEPFSGAPIPIRINGRYLVRNDRINVLLSVPPIR